MKGYLTKVVLALGLCISPALAFAQGVDLFLVIGQSNARGRGPDPGVAPVAGTAYEFNGSGFQPMSSVTGLPTGNYWTSANYGPIPAFAKRWHELTGRRAAFVVRPAGGTGLIAKSDTGNGYWAPNAGISHPIYDRAMNDLVSAYSAAAKDSNIGYISRTYVIWIQGENDIGASVSYSEYSAGLSGLLNRLSSDLYQRTDRFVSGFFMAETGYFWHSTALPTGSTLKEHRDRVAQVVGAQKQFQATASAPVLVSNSARFHMSPCFNGAWAVGCGSWDYIHYTTPTYQRLGKEMAENAWRYVSTGRKPLLADSCRYSPDVCGPTVDVYRWRSESPDDHAASIHSNEFDASANYGFKGVRYHLFRDSAAGRIALYRRYNPATGDYMETTDSGEGGTWYTDSTLLGHCYAGPTANAPVALKRVRLGSNYVTSKDPDELAAWRSAGAVEEKTLCYSQ